MDFLSMRTEQESLKILSELAQECSSLGGPLSSHLNELVKKKEYLTVIQYSFDYCDPSLDLNDVCYARQIQALFSKQDFIDLGVDKEEVAFLKFVQTENLCRETNARLSSGRSLDWDTNGVLYLASQKIARILGRAPVLSELDFMFGPGANTSTKTEEANPRVKLSSRLECSSNLLPVVRELLEELPHLARLNSNGENENTLSVDVTLASGKLAFVPKTSLEHRSIVVEPSLNGLIQKGIGTWMKKRLLRAGIDLSDQHRNQRLAMKGSIDGTLATVDLSSASDTVSRELVWNLLPFEWASLLDCARSETVTYKGEVFLLEKFSSMGNAFTFELESLIFYSLAWACCKYNQIDHELVSVYGDDIVIPVSAYQLLDGVLTECGFILNKKKSFSSGPFRESCGADYFNGFDIRPYYNKTLISDRNLYSMHNWFVRHCEFSLARIALQHTYVPVRLFGPDGYGDGHLIGDYTLRQSRTLQRRGFDGGVFDTYTLKQKSFNRRLPGDFIFPSYSIYVKGDCIDTVATDPDVVRGSRGYKKISIYTLIKTIFHPPTLWGDG